MSYGDHSTDEIKSALSELRRAELKLVVKLAIKEWLDEQAAIVGKWSLRFLMAATLAALAYFILTSQGWHK